MCLSEHHVSDRASAAVVREHTMSYVCTALDRDFQCARMRGALCWSVQ